MSLRTIFQTELRAGMQSWWFWTVLGFFALVFDFPLLIWEPESGTAYIQAYIRSGSVLLPFIGILLGYDSIAGMHDTGRIKTVLSRPHSRSDIILGSFLARAVVLFLGIVGSLVIALIFLLGVASTISFGIYAQFLGVALLLGLAGLAVSMVLSVYFREGARAAGGSIGLLFIWVYVWNLVVNFTLVRALEAEYLPLPNFLELRYFLMGLSPTTSYSFFLRRITETSTRTNAPPQDLLRSSNQLIIPPEFQSTILVIILVLWIILALYFARNFYNDIDVT